jgi:hypothetical protein
MKRLLAELPGLAIYHSYTLLSRVQIAPYNFHLGLLVPSLFGWKTRKVYSGRCEANVLMSSPTLLRQSSRDTVFQHARKGCFWSRSSSATILQLTA